MSNDRCQPLGSVILGLGIGSTVVLKIRSECSNRLIEPVRVAGGNLAPYLDSSILGDPF